MRLLLLLGLGAGAAFAGASVQASEELADVSQVAVRSAPPADASELRRFEVDGALVQTRSALVDLPERASIVRVDSSFIDSGDGLEFCIGGQLDSDPPQCEGPVVDGLDPSGWTQTTDGVAFGERSAYVSWPPVDGRLTRFADGEVRFLDYRAREPLEFPAECESIEELVGPDALAAYRHGNEDKLGVGFVVYDDDLGSNPRHALQVVEEYIDEVRDALSVGGAEPCLVAVEFSLVELKATADEIASLFGDVVGLSSAGYGNIRNRVSVNIQVADRSTVRRVAEAVDDPAMLFVVGNSTILVGT